MEPAAEIGDYPNRVIETVRFSETDMLGHVNNTVFGSYFEIGRTAYFIDKGFYRQDKTALVIVKTEIEYLGMIFWPGSIEIGTRITGFGKSSFTTDQMLCQDGRIVGRSTSTMVAIDPVSGKSRPMPEDLRLLLEA